MPLEDLGYSCRVGECSECCSHQSMIIPVTLPDLFKASVYAKVVDGEDKTIPQIYDEICDGWMFLPDFIDRGWVMPVPKAKLPCPYLDEQLHRCNIHDTHQLVACRSYPIGMLINPMEGLEESEETEAIWRNHPCMEGLELTEEDVPDDVKDLCDLASREIKLTGNLLHNRFQPVRGNIIHGIAELDMRIRMYDRPEYVENLWLNMLQNRLLERYMEYLGIESPDYTRGNAATVEYDDGIIGITLETMTNVVRNETVENAPRDVRTNIQSSNRTIFNTTKIGRNEPCPCDSGKKYKKCCGKNH